MKTVKFLQTSAGTYGVAYTGDKLTLKDSLAAHLEKEGIVEVTGEAGEDAEESKAAHGSFRITQDTPKEKSVKLNTGDEPKEKNAKSGPNAPKKK